MEGEGIVGGVEDEGSDGSERTSCESNLFQTWLCSLETLSHRFPPISNCLKAKSLFVVLSLLLFPDVFRLCLELFSFLIALL